MNDFIFSIFKTLISIINIYYLLIFIRIIITWFPSVSYTTLGRLLSSICDPYLNWFRRFKFLRFGMLDFTPVLAIGVLMMVSSVLQNFMMMNHFSIGILLATIVGMVGSFAHSFLSIVLILLIIRLVVNLLNKDSSDIWRNFDNVLTPIVYKISKIFAPNKIIKHRTILILSVIFTFLAMFLCDFIFGNVSNLLSILPI